MTVRAGGMCHPRALGKSPTTHYRSGPRTALGGKTKMLRWNLELSITFMGMKSDGLLFS